MRVSILTFAEAVIFVPLPHATAHRGLIQECFPILQAYAEIDGHPIEAYELTGGETRIKIITYGAILAEVHRPDRDSKSADIVLGYDDPADYARFRGSAGAVCGRFANRHRRRRLHAGRASL
jgi:hypothetical protein